MILESSLAAYVLSRFLRFDLIDDLKDLTDLAFENLLHLRKLFRAAHAAVKIFETEEDCVRSRTDTLRPLGVVCLLELAR